MAGIGKTQVNRSQVFTLTDGTFVVQWDAWRVQELFSNQFRAFESESDYGRPITDYELEQLKSAGQIIAFNDTEVWLAPTQMHTQVNAQTEVDTTLYAYYLVVSYPPSYLEDLLEILDQRGLTTSYTLQTYGNQLVVVGQQGRFFDSLRSVTQAREELLAKADDIFHNLAIEHITRTSETPTTDEIRVNAPETVQASETGKQILLAVAQDDEREAFSLLFDSMNLETQQASTAAEALTIMEENPPHVLVMDVHLPDLHGWQMIGKVREIEALRDIPIIVIADSANYEMAVAGVSYLARPISIARLRRQIHQTLKQNADFPSEH